MRISSPLPFVMSMMISMVPSSWSLYVERSEPFGSLALGDGPLITIVPVRVGRTNNRGNRLDLYGRLARTPGSAPRLGERASLTVVGQVEMNSAGSAGRVPVDFLRPFCMRRQGATAWLLAGSARSHEPA